MAIDVSASSSAEQSSFVAKKKKENEELENDLIVQKARLERQRAKDITATQEKTNQDLVKISKEGESMVEKTRAIQKNQVLSLNQNSQEHFEKLSKETAEKLKGLDQQAAQQLIQRQNSAMEKVKTFTEKAEDPFYRQKSLEAKVAEREKDYEVKIKLPQHEAQNLFVSTEKNVLKLSLARSFADKSNLDETHANRTSSYQTILESYQLPTQLDPKDMKRDYADGILTIRIGKLI